MSKFILLTLQQQILHVDLHGENVLIKVGKVPEAVLIDFGSTSDLRSEKSDIYFNDVDNKRLLQLETEELYDSFMSLCLDQTTTAMKFQTEVKYFIAWNAVQQADVTKPIFGRGLNQTHWLNDFYDNPDIMKLTLSKLRKEFNKNKQYFSPTTIKSWISQGEVNTFTLKSRGIHSFYRNVEEREDGNILTRCFNCVTSYMRGGVRKTKKINKSLSRTEKKRKAKTNKQNKSRKQKNKRNKIYKKNKRKRISKRK